MTNDNFFSNIIKETTTGSISFRDFMELALYHPEHGYYSSGIAEVGHKGDFYTSPSLHPIFGAVIACQIEEMWKIMDCPPQFDIVEIGAGIGSLAYDILNSISVPFKDTIRYNIIEVNPKSREVLNHNLNPNDRLYIINNLDQLKDIEGCILSNEFIDAQPVHLVEMVDGTLKEIYIDHQFKEIYKDCNHEIIDYIREFAPTFPNNYRTEVNLELKSWLASISKIMSNGFVFTIDYGYTAKEFFDRSCGTLICYHKHTINENPYVNIGIQDITAHVNFSALKKWGEQAGFETVGYCAQGMFLTSMGIDEILEDMEVESPAYKLAVNKVKELVFPTGMGQSHKVLIQSKGHENAKLRGFSFSNKKSLL